jgi:Protein of unknown function (DUF4230)
MVGELSMRTTKEGYHMKRVARWVRSALPEPKVRHARLDHERTTIHSLDRQGFWWLVFSDEPARKLVNKAMKQAQATIQSAAQDPELVEQARRRAERVLRGAFEVIGWDVKLVWDGMPAGNSD